MIENLKTKNKKVREELCNFYSQKKQREEAEIFAERPVSHLSDDERSVCSESGVSGLDYRNAIFRGFLREILKPYIVSHCGQRRHHELCNNTF